MSGISAPPNKRSQAEPRRGAKIIVLIQSFIGQPCQVGIASLRSRHDSPKSGRKGARTADRTTPSAPANLSADGDGGDASHPDDPPSDARPSGPMASSLKVSAFVEMFDPGRALSGPEAAATLAPPPGLQPSGAQREEKYPITPRSLDIVLRCPTPSPPWQHSRCPSDRQATGQGQAWFFLMATFQAPHAAQAWGPDSGGRRIGLTELVVEGKVHRYVS
jgi:hypothetical protein